MHTYCRLPVSLIRGVGDSQSVSTIRRFSKTLKANVKVTEAKRSESFDNDVFFYIEAKRTRSIVGKIISKRSEHVYIKEFKNRSEANTFDSSKIYTKRSEHVYF